MRHETLRPKIWSAIRELVISTGQPWRQGSLAGWLNLIRERVPDAEQSDFLSVVKTLHYFGVIAITRPDQPGGMRLHAASYTGRESDQFFDYFFNLGLLFK